jgi:DNA polymerase III epsilon subunit-like protein
MSKYHDSLPHLNGNILCAVDLETTGRMPGYHEIIQIAVQPLDSKMEPMSGVRPFYTTIAPEYMERAEGAATAVHGLDLPTLKLTSLDQWKVADLFDEWFQSLELPFRKSIVPLAHNWAFEAGFLKSWLGIECMGSMFHPHPRDSMLLAIAINDRSMMRGDPAVYPSVSLTAMCKQLGITTIKAHDALSDALAESKLYQMLMRLPL